MDEEVAPEDEPAVLAVAVEVAVVAAGVKEEVLVVVVVEGVAAGMLMRKERVAPSPWLTKMYLRSI